MHETLDKVTATEQVFTVTIVITVVIRSGTSPVTSALTMFLLHLRNVFRCLWAIFIPFLGKTVANEISFNMAGRVHQRADTHVC